MAIPATGQSSMATGQPTSLLPFSQFPCLPNTSSHPNTNLEVISCVSNLPISRDEGDTTLLGGKYAALFKPTTINAPHDNTVHAVVPIPVKKPSYNNGIPRVTKNPFDALAEEDNVEQKGETEQSAEVKGNDAATKVISTKNWVNNTFHKSISSQEVVEKTINKQKQSNNKEEEAQAQQHSNLDKSKNSATSVTSSNTEDTTTQPNNAHKDMDTVVNSTNSSTPTKITLPQQSQHQQPTTQSEAESSTEEGSEMRTCVIHNDMHDKETLLQDALPIMDQSSGINESLIAHPAPQAIVALTGESPIKILSELTNFWIEGQFVPS